MEVMRHFPPAFVIMASLFFNAVTGHYEENYKNDNSRSITKTTVDWDRASISYGANSVRIVCRTVLPAPRMPSQISLPPDRMEMYVGRKDSDVYYTASFTTDMLDAPSCRASFRLEAKRGNRDGPVGVQVDTEETVGTRTRYVGDCVYDDFSLDSPSRTVSVLISPVTDRDLFVWECSALWGNKEMSAPALRIPILPRWSLAPERRYPKLAVVPRHGNESMKVACVIPGFTKNNMAPYSHRDNYTMVSSLPHLEVSISRRGGNGQGETGFAFRDVYGRFSKSTYSFPVKGAPQTTCTPQQAESPVIHCLGRNPHGPPNTHLPLGFTTLCSSVAYVVSQATANSSETRIKTSSPIWITSTLLKDYFEAFDDDDDDESHSTYPFVTMDFDRPHVVVQLPSDKGIRPLRLHSRPTQKYMRLGGGGELIWHIDDYVNHLMPDNGITTSFYMAVTNSISSRPFLTGLKLVPSLNPNTGLLSARLSCHPEGGRVIFIASAACEVSGGTYVPVADDHNENDDGHAKNNNNNNNNKHTHTNRTPGGDRGVWCGEGGGRYKVHVRDLDPGTTILLTKRKQPSTGSYIYAEMTCAWRQYYCLTGERTRPLQSVVLLDPHPSEQGQSHVPWYGLRRKINLGGKEVVPWEIISPNMCPYGEERNATVLPTDKHVFVPGIIPRYPVDTDDIRSWTRFGVSRMNAALSNKRSDEKTTVMQMKDTCACKQQLNLCEVPSLQGVVGYAVIDFGEVDLSDLYQCNAMGRPSPSRSYASLVTDYVCGDSVRVVPRDEQHLIKLLLHLPEIDTVVDRNLVRSIDGNEDYVRVSCLNVKKKCLRNLIITRHVKKDSLSPNTSNNNITAKWVSPSSAAIRFHSPHAGYSALTVYENGTADSMVVCDYNKGNVTNNSCTVAEDDVVVPVENPLTRFNEGDVPIEYLFRRAFVERYSQVTCVYLGGYLPGKSASLASGLKKVCTNLDYEADILSDFSDPEVKAFTCRVKYDSSKNCGVPSVKVSVQALGDGDVAPSVSVPSVSCLGTMNGKVVVGRERHRFEDSGESPVTFDSGAIGRAYCVYDQISKQTWTTLLLRNVTSHAINSSFLEVSCTVLQTMENINFTESRRMVNQTDIHTGSDSLLSCIQPPSVYRPVVGMVAAHGNVTSTVVTCSMPTWLHPNVCHGLTSVSMGELVVYVETSSSLKTKTTRGIAMLDRGGKCHVAPGGHACRVNNGNDYRGHHGNKWLMEVRIQDFEVHDVAGDPGAMALAFCQMNGGAKLISNKVMLKPGLDRVAFKKKMAERTVSLNATMSKKDAPDVEKAEKESAVTVSGRGPNVFKYALLATGVLCLLSVVTVIAMATRCLRDKKAMHYTSMEMQMMES